MECSVADGSHEFHDHTNLCLLIALWQTVLMSIHDHKLFDNIAVLQISGYLKISIMVDTGDSQIRIEKTILYLNICQHQCIISVYW
jgi:hypothetical protein